MDERFRVNAEGVLMESVPGGTRELTVADLAALDVESRKTASLVYQRAMAQKRATTHSSPFWKRPVADD